ncbi:hypothetical protein C2S52_011150 [Perilla frutescens var. hirtella]|nr:hypothetical protein C2S52_011150 [Perilla frutescens var. hirtella]KAH6817949.1 hypothetical protein C2S51_001552 [Perilla frutescens var. frutescens]
MHSGGLMVCTHNLGLQTLRHRHVVVGFFLLLIAGEEEKEQCGGAEDLIEHDQNSNILGNVGSPVVEEVDDDPVWVFFGDKFTDGVLEGVTYGFEGLYFIEGDVAGGLGGFQEKVVGEREIWKDFGVEWKNEDVNTLFSMVMKRSKNGTMWPKASHDSITTCNSSMFEPNAKQIIVGTL